MELLSTLIRLLTGLIGPYFSTNYAMIIMSQEIFTGLLKHSIGKLSHVLDLTMSIVVGSKPHVVFAKATHFHLLCSVFSLTT